MVDWFTIYAGVGSCLLMGSCRKSDPDDYFKQEALLSNISIIVSFVSLM